MSNKSTYHGIVKEQREYLIWIVDRLTNDMEIPSSINMTEVQIIDTANIISHILKTGRYNYDERLWLNSLRDIYIKLKKYDSIRKPTIFSTGGEIGKNDYKDMWEYTAKKISAGDFYKEYQGTWAGVDMGVSDNHYLDMIIVNHSNMI